jgi:hypothetical protein
MPPRLRNLFSNIFSCRFAPANLFLGIHCAAAVFCAAVAKRLVLAAVVEAVVVGNLLAGDDVAQSRDPDSSVLLDTLAVGIATVIDKHRRAMAVDDDRAVSESKQVGDGGVLVGGVGLVPRKAVPGVLGHALALANGGGGVAAGGVDGGGSDDESHANVRCFPKGPYEPHPTIKGMRLWA